MKLSRFYSENKFVKQDTNFQNGLETHFQAVLVLIPCKKPLLAEIGHFYANNYGGSV